MNTGICSCEMPSFGNLGRPNCVIEQGVLFSPMFMPRYRSNGDRNTLDLSVDPMTIPDSDGQTGNYATFGAYIKDRIENVNWHPSDRFYPMPEVENATFDRTETGFETAPSTRRYKIDTGGVRTFSMELWGKNSVAGMFRELNKYGCSEIDFAYVDIQGNMWVVKDEIKSTIVRGYAIDEETFDVFKTYATNTSKNKLMVSFDLDNQECEENSFAIIPEDLGYKATTLTGLISAYSTSSNATLTTIVVDVNANYGKAKQAKSIKGLVDADFVVKDATGTVLPHTGTVENSDGVYTITMTALLTASENYTVDTFAKGYAVTPSGFTA